METSQDTGATHEVITGEQLWEGSGSKKSHKETEMNPHKLNT